MGETNDDAFLEDLKERTVRVGLENHVRFLGWRSDVLDVLAAMDVYVLPSLDEGTPRSIVESMALAIPVIATDVGGISELLGAKTPDDDQTGLLVAAGDASELTAAMARLAGDPALRRKLGENGRRIAHRDYSFQSHLEGLWRILDSARQ